ncbi:MAG: hypothetical protein WBW33_02820 [Bryobacteraceae bacterium]
MADRLAPYYRTLALLLMVCLSGSGLSAKDRWAELNIGPFLVATDGDIGQAREVLTQLEQMRWMLGGLLDIREINTLWPVRVLITAAAKPTVGVVQARDGYIVVLAPGSRPPMSALAKLFLQENTPRLPAEVERGFPKLFSTFEAKGTRITWGGPPADPDLDWARVQLFATQPDYAGRFHVFMTNLRNGSSLSIAARNAFGKSLPDLDHEAGALLTPGAAHAVTIGGRPLDPRRDFGEHTLDATVASVYLADAHATDDPQAARPAYQAAIENGGAAVALGKEGLALLRRLEQKDEHSLLEDAMAAGSKSAPVYMLAAEGQSTEVAVGLLKKAQVFNPRWGEPVFREAELMKSNQERERLYQQAAKLNQRSAEYWQALAEVQVASEHLVAAQGSWLRAEAACDTDAQREKIQARRLSLEDVRLDAAERERRLKQAAVEADLARVQNDQLQRIHEAEKKANADLEKSSGAPAANPVPWWDDPAQRTLKGDLVRVDCVGNQTKFRIRVADGSTMILLIRDLKMVSIEGTESAFTCGPQEPPRKVSVHYSAHPDKRAGSDGDIIAVHFD